MSIGFLGFGNMAMALAQGLKKANKNVTLNASARDYNKLVDNTTKLNVIPYRTNEEMIKSSNVIIIAIKPYQVEILKEYKDILIGKTIVSVVAGYDLEKYQALLGKDIHIICTCPSTPVAVNEGVIAYENKWSLTESEFKSFNDIFTKLGLLVETDASHFNVYGTAGGCTPAFVAMFIEALSDAFVKHGISRKESYEIASKVLAGTAKLQQEKGCHPGQMKDAVCSPGGTTIKGVASLEESGFRGTIIKAIDAILDK